MTNFPGWQVTAERMRSAATSVEVSVFGYRSGGTARDPRRCGGRLSPAPADVEGTSAGLAGIPVGHPVLAAVEWFEAHRGPAGAYLAALRATPILITSVNTDGFASRLGEGGCPGERWLVNWMPELVLTRKQVYSVMVFHEILLAHDLDSGTMLAMLRDLAADVYVPMEKILRRLNHIGRPRGITLRES
ncbi:hypothetical protein [Nocardia macrotermitis]|uniref:Uncharacterized protein n=1 Tax=Nocardia macrotermitis TaxID=2585198 RepID=A0A7K0CW41_9NOCA|nr:hypothetical protein [Nocardia macrotermitis]MQY17611.1 hypothetical protein [Nocardia macrotermitis]